MSRLDPEVERGDVWWANLGGSYRRRPVLVVTSPEILPLLTSVTVVPLTIRIRSTPYEVLLHADEHDLDADSAANCLNLLTIPKRDLIRRVTQIDHMKMRLVSEAVIRALDLH
ncbi:MAG: type II toxin-antitoxin system PemK/MazF family toxin [Planctomycetota bacterium]